MKQLIIFLSFIFLYPILSQSQQLQQTIRGTIIDNQSGNILSNVTVWVESQNPTIKTISDSLGNFKLTYIPIGRHTIKASITGYDEITIANIEVTSSKEVILEIKLNERIHKLQDVTVTAGRRKDKALNEAAVVSARQLSIDEAMRYSGSRNDPSRMAQNFAGVSGSNDSRNDLVIRGNSPAGVLWRMEGIDIPNPNHYSTLGSTGGPVTILNTNTLKNSDFITSAFPAQYGNALAGVFDLRLRNGNNEKYEYLGQMGFNGFEFAAEGPISKRNKSSFLVDYRYSMVATIQAMGLDVGTGNATPYYQDITFKVNIPTKKYGTFSWFGLGGESHVTFPAVDKENLYVTNDGSLRERKFVSLTGVTGFSHSYFFTPTTQGKLTLAVSGLDVDYKETFYKTVPDSIAFSKKNVQIKYSVGYTINKKFNAKNQLTIGTNADFNDLKLRNDHIPNGSRTLTILYDTKAHGTLLKSFANYAYRFTEKLSSNIGIYHQLFTLNNKQSIEPRFNIKHQLKPNQSISFGIGLHSQIQPLEYYFYESTNNLAQIELTNKNLDFNKSWHAVIGYDISCSKNLRVKAEVYGQSIFNVAVEKTPTSFSLLNSGADFYFPSKTNLFNNGEGYNYGVELTVERFLHKGFYFLFTSSLFNSQYKGSDNVWRNTAFNSGFTSNFLTGKEFAINKKSSIGIDTKIAWAGGQYYTPFDIATSKQKGYVVLKNTEAYSLQNPNYLRWDLKFAYNRNGKKTTQKWYIDLQNITNRKNVYIRTLTPSTGKISTIYQIGFFPNINYQITF